MSPSNVTLDLITLYTATQEEREARSQEQRARNNKLMSSNNVAPPPGEAQIFELQPHVKELCRGLDGFVFVIDVTLPAESSEQYFM